MRGGEGAMDLDAVESYVARASFDDQTGLLGRIVETESQNVSIVLVYHSYVPPSSDGASDGDELMQERNQS